MSAFMETKQPEFSYLCLIFGSNHEFRIDNKVMNWIYFIYKTKLSKKIRKKHTRKNKEINETKTVHTAPHAWFLFFLVFLEGKLLYAPFFSSVGRSVGTSYFPKRSGNFLFHVPIGALVSLVLVWLRSYFLFLSLQ